MELKIWDFVSGSRWPSTWKVFVGTSGDSNNFLRRIFASREYGGVYDFFAWLNLCLHVANSSKTQNGSPLFQKGKRMEGVSFLGGGKTKHPKKEKVFQETRNLGAN